MRNYWLQKMCSQSFSLFFFYRGFLKAKYGKETMKSLYFARVVGGKKKEDK